MSFLGNSGAQLGGASQAAVGSGTASGGFGSGFNAAKVANALNAAGSIASGIGQRNAARENEKIQEQNQILALQATSDKLRERRRRIGKDFAKQKTQFLSSGVELEGSPLLVLEETIELGEQDLTAIRIAGGVQSETARLKGKAARTAGETALFSSLLTAGNTLLTKKQTTVKIK